MHLFSGSSRPTSSVSLGDQDHARAQPKGILVNSPASPQQGRGHSNSARQSIRPEQISPNSGARESAPGSGTVSQSKAARRLSLGRVAHEFPHPPPSHVVRALKRVLSEETKTFKIHDYIEVEDLVNGRLWEVEQELTVDCVRDRVDDDSGHDGVWRRERRKRVLEEAVLRKIAQRERTVFGSYIQDLPGDAMVPLIVGGYRHYVPTVVQACIEALYDIGIYQQGLFQTLPNRTRLFELVAFFDMPQPSSHAIFIRGSVPNVKAPPPPSSLSSRSQSLTIPRPLSLRQESPRDVCALLITYLTSLPTPLIHPTLVPALWAWCVSPSLMRQAQRHRRRGDADASSSESDSSSSSDDEQGRYASRVKKREEAVLNLPPLRVQIKIARQVLLLLPKRNFSVLVYFVVFLEAVLSIPDAELSIEDIGRIFGAAIAGGRTQRGATPGDEGANSGGQAASREEKGHKITVWLVKHWRQISSAYETDGTDRECTGQRRLSSLAPTNDDEAQPRTDCAKVDYPYTEEENSDKTPQMEPPKEFSKPVRGDEDGFVPKLELPRDVAQDPDLFKTLAPFDVRSSGQRDEDDDTSIYSSDNNSVYDMSALNEPEPGSFIKATSPSIQPQLQLGADALAASRFVLERENVELKRQLEKALLERNEARELVEAMRGLVGKLSK